MRQEQPVLLLGCQIVVAVLTLRLVLSLCLQSSHEVLYFWESELFPLWVETMTTTDRRSDGEGLGVFLLAMWGCCRASTSCLWAGKVIARVSSCKGRLAGIDLLVVPMFEASGGCVVAATLITAWSALIAVSNGCCNSPYCKGDVVVGAVAICVSSFGDAVGEVGIEVCVSGETNGTRTQAHAQAVFC